MTLFGENRFSVPTDDIQCTCWWYSVYLLMIFKVFFSG